MVLYLHPKLQAKSTTTRVGQAFKLELLDAVHRKLGPLTKIPIHAIATIVDPRFKNILFSDNLIVEECLKINWLQLMKNQMKWK